MAGYALCLEVERQGGRESRGGVEEGGKQGGREGVWGGRGASEIDMEEEEEEERSGTLHRREEGIHIC